MKTINPSAKKRWFQALWQQKDHKASSGSQALPQDPVDTVQTGRPEPTFLSSVGVGVGGGIVMHVATCGLPLLFGAAAGTTGLIIAAASFPVLGAGIGALAYMMGDPLSTWSR